MVVKFVSKFFGTVNSRFLKTLEPRVEAINALEAEIQKLSDNELQAKTDAFKKRLGQGETIDDLLEEAFAVVREASVRTLGMRHFDVQLIGGMCLHQGMISEMKTGEGKTLVATLPVYLNALSGNGVHVVSVNDYLVQRDSEWMGAIYKFLGLSVGCVTNDMDDYQRKESYAADVTYATNNELGFDYLRDNMKFSREEMVQRGFNYAIVDEVDSILIDEARTPLIISGPVEDSSEMYHQADKLIPKLDKETDYEVDEKAKSATLTEEGTQKIEDMLKKEGLLTKEQSLYDIDSISLVHHVNQALKAHTLFAKDTDYIVKDGKVVIIDEFTGRMMEGRRYSEGLHQALEAKEDVPVQNENQTLASITFQNYFRLYSKLAGMTGTAMTEADEFADIYGLEVREIPTNLEVTRVDEDDEIYRTADEKYEAILKTIKDCHKRKQPVLVGTVSIERSEHIAKLLKKAKIPHNVLNAKQHEREAYIIAQAGQPGAVTIATNMAGRGTDIMLGGNPEMLLKEKQGAKEADITKQVEADKKQVLEAGGLYVLATERHESRRIDNQLRGRSGRQGDPGNTKFFLSLEDDLMRIFGSDRISGMLQKLGLEEGEAITHPWISRAIEKAQQKVEAHNYEIRKNLLKFDNVMNDQRKVIYEQRLELMDTEDVRDTLQDMIEEVSEDLVTAHIPEKSYAEQWDMIGLEKEVFRIFGLNMALESLAKKEGVDEEQILEEINAKSKALFDGKEQKYGPEIMRLAEKKVLLLTLDQLWKDHLLSLDHLRQGINLRAYGQKDPLNEYKREAFYMFESMLAQLREVVVMRMAHMELNLEEPMQAVRMQEEGAAHMTATRNDPAMATAAAGVKGNAVVSGNTKRHVAPEERNPSDPLSWGKVARNEVCPCGSGKKYKHCHGKLA